MPKPTPKEEKVIVDVKKSSIKTNSTRQKRQVQSTRPPAKEISLDITKSSSQLNPRSTRNMKKKKTVEIKEVKTRPSRKIINNAISDKNAEKNESLPEQGIRKRGRKTKIIEEVIQKPVKRGRKNITENKTKEAGGSTKGRKTRAITETQCNVETIKDKPANKITKQVINTTGKENEAPNKSSRRTRQKTEVEESADTKKTTRGRSAKNNIAIDEKQVSLKEKVKASGIKSVEKVPPKTRRGVKTDTNEENKQIEGKSKGKKQITNTNEVRKTRNAVKEGEVKPTRGRKVSYYFFLFY